ncbi:Prothrombin [Holothuria leucospilota]|uniref:Prothrombin n=1 Tax=Holothuria leucospilota TaxID=206669 RepID=A0A9Q1CJ82_HOLLE|nr:Prothrombin [Holothuria leucospilota]
MRLWIQVTLTILMLYKVCSNPNAQDSTEGSTEPRNRIDANVFVSGVPEEFRRHFVLAQGGRKVLFHPEESRCSKALKWLEETYSGNVAMISRLITCNLASCLATGRGGRTFCGRNALGHTRSFRNKCHQCAEGCNDFEGGGTRYVSVRELECRRAEQECKALSCASNSSCVYTETGYMCQCPAGFQGNICDVNIDECASSPCQNGGTCRDMVNGYTCNCAPGFEGNNCDASSESELHVSLQISHTNPGLGDRVTVRCDATDVNALLRWYKDGLRLETGLYDDLFVLSSAILILEFDYIHQGDYSCRALREEDGAIAEVDFTFRLPLDVQFATYPQNIKIPQYSNGVLHCSPVNRLHVVRWEKDDAPLRMNEHVFQAFDDIVIIDATEREAGVYTCVLYSGSHRIREVTAQVTVDEPGKANEESRLPAEALFATYPENSTILQYGDHVLPCSPVDPSHIVRWEKDGNPLEMNERLSTEPGESILIANATLLQAGIYTCVLYSGYQRIKDVSAHVTVVARQEIYEICGTISAEEAVDRDSSAGTGRTFRIIGGQRAVHGSSPWTVRLYDSSERLHICAGSIVSNLWVISVASCIYFSGVTVNTLMVRLGDYDSRVTDDSEILVGVAEIVFYDGFNTSTYDQNIALIRLSTPVVFTDYLRPICLPSVTLARKLYKAGIQGKVTGWGRIAESGPLPRYLTEVNLPLVGKRRCRASTNYTVTTNMFCAGYPRESADACSGDSGGPFAVDFQGRWYLLGIVSWGEGCGREGKYGFYTRVSKFLDWTNSYIYS